MKGNSKGEVSHKFQEKEVTLVYLTYTFMRFSMMSRLLTATRTTTQRLNNPAWLCPFIQSQIYFKDAERERGEQKSKKKKDIYQNRGDYLFEDSVRAEWTLPRPPMSWHRRPIREPSICVS